MVEFNGKNFAFVSDWFTKKGSPQTFHCSFLQNVLNFDQNVNESVSMQSTYIQKLATPFWRGAALG